MTIGFGVSQFIDGLYAITGMEWTMNMTGDAPAPGTVGLIAGLIIIMGLSIISAVSGVGRGVKYLSNLKLVLSLVLLFTFVVFGSFLFAMTTYATAFVDYVLHFISLSFVAYGSQSAADFAAALPSEAAPFADALGGSATNAWGSYDGFVGGLEGDAANLSPEVLGAKFMPQVRQVANLVGKQAGPHSIGHGGSHFRHSLDCSWHAFHEVARYVNSSSDV